MPAGADTAQELLIEMGDDAAINRQFRKLLERRDGSIFVYQNPKIVRAVAPLLSGDEPFTREIYAQPLSFRASGGILQHLWRSPYYTQQVRDWAKTVNYSVFDSTEKNAKFERNAMRRWWTANKAAYLRGDYLAVKPGEPPPDLAPKPSATIAVAVASPLTVATPVSTPQLSPTPAIKSIAPVSGFPLLAVVILLLALAVVTIVYLVWKRK